MRRPVFALAISACFLGCGGNVVVDHGGAGGRGGAGGHGFGGGSATEGPGPTVGSVTSSSTVGETATSSGTSTTCPGPDKVYEDAGCQVEGLSCPMNRSCCGGSAVCKGGAWHFAGALCNMPCIPCGPDDGFACELGSLCVDEERDVGTTYHCAQDPCPPGGEACGCAASLCEGLTCEQVTGQTLVLCDCPNC